MVRNVGCLRKVGIAHGDLSHGNIMVLDDEFRLIDYDGMFVPRLAGRKSNERGLEHYQHPGRTDAHFGRYLDNFSHWVMYTTLVALGEDKELWRLVNIADKHLIFSPKKRFGTSAARSKTFDILKSHDDKTLRTYATTVENLPKYDIEQIPDFHPDKPIFPPDYSQTKTTPSARWAIRVACSSPLKKRRRRSWRRLFDNPVQERDRGNLFVETVKTEEIRKTRPYRDMEDEGLILS